MTILFSDRGTRNGYRHMDGFSSHTFSLINDKNELFYVLEGEYIAEIGPERFHLKSGDSILGPRKVPHAWAFVGNTPGKPGVPLQAAAASLGWASELRRKCTERTGPPAQQLVLIC